MPGRNSNPFIMKKKKRKTKKKNTTKRKKSKSDDDFSDASSDGSDASVITVRTNYKDKHESKHGSKKDDEGKKKYTVKEIKRHLSGYIKVNPSNWREIENKTHIRYFYRKDKDPDFSIEEYKDKFNRGGFIQFRKANQAQDGDEQWIFGLTYGYAYNKENIRIVSLKKIKSIWKKRNKNIKPEIDEMAGSVVKYQKNAWGNQTNLQDQINSLYEIIEKIQEEDKDKRSEIKTEVERNRDSLENLVEFVRKKTEKMERRHSR